MLLFPPAARPGERRGATAAPGLATARVPRRHLKPSERAFWVGLVRPLPSWRKVLLAASPETDLRCHRACFQALGRRNSRRRIGRPEISRKRYGLIRKLARETTTWGTHRITDKLALLGWNVGTSSV